MSNLAIPPFPWYLLYGDFAKCTSHMARFLHLATDYPRNVYWHRPHYDLLWKKHTYQRLHVVDECSVQEMRRLWGVLLE